MTERMKHVSTVVGLGQETTTIDALRPVKEKTALGLAEQSVPLRCPLCRRKVFSVSNGALRLRTRILVFKNGRAITKCKYCRNDIHVPIVMFDFANEESLPVWDSELHGKVE